MVLKPSEISKNTERVLVELLPQYLDQVGMAVPGGTWHPHTAVPASGEVPLPWVCLLSSVLPYRAALL